ncbi:MAG: DsrE family protein [Nocardioidaceae bacterium]|nr:MAG: DsrE family protein [Nocardioidaceae bacterium]
MMRLVSKVTVGADEPEKVNQAFSVAAAAIAAGSQVSVWLTGEATRLAVPGGADAIRLDHATPLGELIALVIDQAALTVCSQCAARRGLEYEDLLAGVRIAGAATFAEEALTEGTQALVY